MGRSHAFTFEDYFTDLYIIKSLITYRLKLSKKRHDQFFFERFVQSENLRSNETEVQLSKIFPPRNHWKRPCIKKRAKPKEGNSHSESLLFTINHYRRLPLENQPQWVFELNKFISEIRSKALYSSTIELPPPKLVPASKNKKDGDFELYRPISIVEDLASNIVMKLVARYLMDKLDIVFKKSSFAYRRRKIYQNRIPTHHDCYEEIKRFKGGKTDLYVSECDIKAFFDTISHSEIRNSYARIKEVLFKRNGTKIFDRADGFIEAFLSSYSIDYAISESEKYFEGHNLKGRLAFPKDELLNTFYSGNEEALKSIGIPQGSSLSILFANLILHDNDQLMEERFNDRNEFLYMRFCDDMIILSTKEKAANEAYENYISLLKEKKLLYHNETSLLPYTEAAFKRDFWDRKSRKGFLWSKNSYPWIAFVGYQVRYDDFVRIRPSSIKNELNKQKEFVKNILRKVKREIKGGHITRILKSHKSILKRATGRMIASAVGRVSILENKADSNISWINGFRGVLKEENVFRNSLKELDRNRDRQLKSLNENLIYLLQDHQVQVKRKRPAPLFKVMYPGPPFSYYRCSFLKDKSDIAINEKSPEFATKTISFINVKISTLLTMCSKLARYAGTIFDSFISKLILEGFSKSKERK
ncbi:reverse transcriptase domain-containing protein [Leptospira interrogans]|uniref:reverse transcriptase domain-containing protein n=1 Tax=Leptospira interrogans TaxID=173 RepID=UPI0002BB72A0|nr:RNA-directed DNA polymerase [Leptospira interrogans serovar Grippotyphosa str. UI 12764]EMO92285.1 RNA-directed DNA polymerase [Leptospira interrogans str. UI 13372]